MELREHAPRQVGMPYREDCWSDGETSALVDAWGERYLELNRGSLRQKQWQEVADAVNTRAGMTRRKMRTDVQCKNRIDTLKKKYKQEKAKIVEGTALTSQWPFYGRLDVLIGAGMVTPGGSGSGSNGIGMRRPSPAQSSSPPLALPIPFYRKGSTPLPAAAPLRIGNRSPQLPMATALPADNSFIRKAAAAAAAAAAASSSYPITSSFTRKTPPVAPPPMPHIDNSYMRRPAPPVDNYFIRKAAVAAAAAKEEAMDDDEEEEEDELSESNSERRSVSWNERRRGKKRKGGDGIMELAKAIDKMGEMYERVEEARQREMIEMEKQRMDFVKGLELQRMQLFADLKVQLERIKRSRRTAQAGEIIGSISAVSFLSNPSFL